MLLNLRATHPELRDVRVRRALLAAIDRDALVQAALGGDGIAADTLVPPSSWAFDASVAKPVAYSTKTAAKLLDDAGWTKKNGKWTAPKGKAPYRLEILSVPAEANPRLAAVTAAVGDAWTALGIGVDVVEVPATDLATRLRDGKFAASVARHHDRHRARPLPAARLDPGALLGEQPERLPGPGARHAARGRSQARRARGQGRRAGRRSCTGLAARQPLLPLAWTAEPVLLPRRRGLHDPAHRRPG